MVLMLFLRNNSRKILFTLPAISGALLVLASPIFGVGWVSLFALVPFLLFLKKTENKKTAFLGGAVLGFVYFLGVLYPLTSIDWWGFRGDGPVSQTIFLFASWPFFSLFGSLFFAVASLIFFELKQKIPLGNPVSKYGELFLFPAIFVLLTEFLRSLAIFNFTWGFVGYSLHNVFYLPQLAAFGGIYLLSFLVYFFNAAIFSSVFPNLEAELPSWRRGVKGAGIIAVLFLILNYIGFNHYGLMKEEIALSGPELKVAVLQGNIKQSAILPGDELNIEKPYLDMIGKALAEDADILVLPESVIPGNITLMSDGGNYFSKEAVVLKEKIENFWKEKFGAGNKNLMAVFGIGVLKEKEDYNALVYADGNGIIGKYYKRYLVPFGEYQPAWLAKFAPKSLFKRTPGGSAMLVKNNGVNFGSLICQEAMYPGLWRDSVLAGANVLINAGNDGIFGSEKGAEMMAIMAKIRAIESGRFTVRAMKTGVSAIFEPTGDEIARANFNETALLFGKIKPLDDLTLYSRFGNWILVLSAGVVALYIWGWYNREVKSSK